MIAVELLEAIAADQCPYCQEPLDDCQCGWVEEAIAEVNELGK